VAYIPYKEFPLFRHVEEDFPPLAFDPDQKMKFELKPLKDETMIIYEVHFPKTHDIIHGNFYFHYEHPDVTIHPVKLDETLIRFGHPVEPPAYVFKHIPFTLIVENRDLVTRIVNAKLWYFLTTEHAATTYRQYLNKVIGRAIARA